MPYRIAPTPNPIKDKPIIFLAFTNEYTIDNAPPTTIPTEDKIIKIAETFFMTFLHSSIQRIISILPFQRHIRNQITES